MRDDDKDMDEDDDDVDSDDVVAAAAAADSCPSAHQHASQPPRFYSLQLMGEVLSRLNGSYALLVKSSHYPGELIACKKGSPLILGMKCDDAEPTHGVRTIARRSLSSSLRATGSLPLPATMSLSPPPPEAISSGAWGAATSRRGWS